MLSSALSTRYYLYVINWSHIWLGSDRNIFNWIASSKGSVVNSSFFSTKCWLAQLVEFVIVAQTHVRSKESRRSGVRVFGTDTLNSGFRPNLGVNHMRRSWSYYSGWLYAGNYGITSARSLIHNIIITAPFSSSLFCWIYNIGETGRTGTGGVNWANRWITYFQW